MAVVTGSPAQIPQKVQPRAPGGETGSYFFLKGAKLG
jgi:hypothetical protein